MKHSIDERRLQRVIDNECGPEERQEFLATLDKTPDGWKTLACGFLENQLFADALGAKPGEPFLLGHQTTGKPAPVKLSRGWFHHPVVSVALTACLAFLFGVLVARPFNSDRSNAIAASEPTDSGSAIAASGQLTALPPRLTLRSEGQKPVSIPVVNNVSDFVSGIQSLRQPESQWPEQLPATPRGSLKFYKIRSGDEIFLVPVSDRIPEHSFH